MLYKADWLLGQRHNNLNGDEGNKKAGERTTKAGNISLVQSKLQVATYKEERLCVGERKKENTSGLLYDKDSELLHLPYRERARVRERNTVPLQYATFTCAS